MPNNRDKKIPGRASQMTTQSSRSIFQDRYRLRAQAKPTSGPKHVKRFMYRIKGKKARNTAIFTHARQAKVGQAGDTRVSQGHQRKCKAIRTSQQQRDSIVPSSRQLSGVRCLTLAQISVARRRKSVIKVVPTAVEESGEESEYFSAPSSPLIDGRETKRRRGDVKPARASPAPNEGEPKCLEANRRSRNEQIENENEDEDVQEVTPQDWLKSVIKTRPARSFNDLPDSCILQILDTLYEQEDGKLVSSVCFGLTCRHYWSIFKMQWCCPSRNTIYNAYAPKEDQALLAPLL
ncbi:446b3973-f1b0-4cf9-a7f3-34e9008c555f [Sclerotinia trifoliorum]|uniref:446b3973-f1b0-4cf9-a7f3-34e9008c555f n=1 Tax=Sclerotinia trifoliorum TaxID=28548 RepID=A0A8H2ZUH9_9HELO|nr:446b3973-f1b0-4cf9-a7f3-34e9008c555f [Sclerotinia trifoliorum]